MDARSHLVQAVLACVWLVGVAACDIETLLNQTASFGPDGGQNPAGAPISSGARGNIRVVFENQTPFRTIFTYGMYDNTDERSSPVFLQFSPDAQLSPPGAPASIEGTQTTPVITLPCARVFAVGSRSLINLVAENPGAVAPLIDEPALLDGVGFSSASITSDFAATPNEGFAAGFEALLGVDFNCGSLLLVRLDFADAGPDRFLVDMRVFPSDGS